MTGAAGYRLTLRCDTCEVSHQCDVIGSDLNPSLGAMTRGWETIHAGHEQKILASSLHVEELAGCHRGR